MTPEKWGQIKNIFLEAIAQPVPERVEFVQRECGNDRELGFEVGRLLEAAETAGSFLDTPAVDLHGYIEEPNDSNSLEPGSFISGRFEIIRFLNRGGMGEVYEAWDSELKERVAVKTIRPKIAFDSEVIERFKQEVKHARTISHPNVCRVHELFIHEPSPGQKIWFLSMELLEGSTLLEHIRYQGPLEPARALNLVEQMVSGLMEAHSHGLVHRDFKSNNVFLISGTGGRTRAVITDFGLSLSIFRSRGGLAEPAGMGTPGYMAPEQKEGGEVGPLADQYALGVVMCEMLTGVLPSQLSQTGSDSKLALKLSERKLGSRWERVIRRCLEPKPEDRYEDVKHVIRALKPADRFSTQWKVGFVAALLCLIAASTILMRRQSVTSRITGLTQLTPGTDFSDSPSLSRDGKMVAYASDRAQAGNVDIFTQQLPDGRPIRVTTNVAQDTNPSVAPNGSSIVFRSERDGGGVYIANVSGGQERLLVARGRDPKFSPDGFHVLYWVGGIDLTVPSGKIYVLDLRGGPPVRIAESFRDARLPVWGSDGQWILFSGCRAGGPPMPACSDWWAISSDGKGFQNTHALAGLTAEQIAPTEGLVDGWYGDSLLFSGRKGSQVSLWMLKLAPGDFKVVGGPEQLTPGETRDMSPSLAENGTLAYTRFVGALHLWRIDNASHPNAAVLSKVTEDPGVDVSPFVSSNGRWIVFTRGWGNHRDAWIKDTHSMIEAPLLATGLEMMSPIIDDTGKFLAFEGREKNVPSIFTSFQGEAPKRLCTGCSLPSGWFDVNRAVLYREGLTSSIKMADPRTGEQRSVLKESGASLSEPSWSPQNEYLLFTKENEGGEGKQIFAVHLPKSTGAVAGKWISVTKESEWGDRPRWSGDGRTIYYVSKRDGFSCLWGQDFDPEAGEMRGAPFPIMHFHNPRSSIDVVAPRSFNLSVAGDSIYFNLGESSSSIWIGTLKNKKSPLRNLF